MTVVGDSSMVHIAHVTDTEFLHISVTSLSLRFLCFIFRFTYCTFSTDGGLSCVYISVIYILLHTYILATVLLVFLSLPLLEGN